MPSPSAAESGDSRAVIRRLIENAANSTAAEVDPRLLKAIKYAARSSDHEIRSAVDALMYHMKKPHSQVRFLSILIIDELFMRSKLFRSLIVENFDQLLALCVGFRRDMQLPPPASIASNLQKKGIELLEKWNESFGMHYRQVRLGFHYLKNTLRYQFPNRVENAERLQQERRARELEGQRILLEKYEKLKEKHLSIKMEISSTIDEIEECIQILNAKRPEMFTDIAVEDSVGEENVAFSLREIRLAAMKESEKILEDNDNRAVFDMLRELLKLVESKHLSTVKDCISVLIRVDLDDNSFRDSALKEFIDIRNNIQSVKGKYAKLGCSLGDNPMKMVEEDEDLWEEGKIEEFVPNNVAKDPGKNSKGAPTCDKGKALAIADEEETSDNSKTTSERSKLLSEAPVVSWGPFLENWGSNRDVLANQRGLELVGHWGRVDYDAVIPAEKIAELSVHRTVYNEEPVEIQPCHAPLKKGGLCQRRDLRVCPFHGLIIPRDDEGKPLEPNQCDKRKFEDETDKKLTEVKTFSVKDDSSFSSKGMTFEKLAKQAVKNVRDRDKEAHALKQAKRAKVREHNEAVLRESAMASTSHSQFIEEHADASVENRTKIKAKKTTLASMLKKKVTAKDRITQRLLNTRVTDSASRQILQAEDSNYREAFPNQW